MKTLATLVAALGLSLSLAGTASAHDAELGFAPNKDTGIAPAACYYKYVWIGNYYMRELICF